MNPQDEYLDRLFSKHHEGPSIWKILLIICSVFLSFIFVAAIALVLYAYSWRMGDLSFHESWNAEQKADLLDIDNQLLHPTTTGYLQQVYKNVPMDSTLITLLHREDYANARGALKHAAKTGKDATDKDAFLGMTAAHLACQYGKAQLLQELIRRGTDPCAVYSPNSSNASVFEVAVLPDLLPHHELLPSQERVALLDFLASSGADIRRDDDDGYSHTFYVASNCVYYDTPEGDNGQTLTWLMEHGALPSPEDANITLNTLFAHSEKILPMFREWHSKRFLDKAYATPHDKIKLLNTLIRECFHPNIVEKVRWALDDLGADPSTPVYKPQDEDDENVEYGEEDDEEEWDEPCDDDDDEYGDEYDSRRYSTSSVVEQCLIRIKRGMNAEQFLEVLELLLDHGGKMEPEWVEEYAPQVAEHKERYLQIIHKQRENRE